MKPRLFDSAIVNNAQEAVDFITNILESSTEYSVIGKDLDGKILLWNEGARRLYGYEPEEVVGTAISSILHTPEDVQSGKTQEIHQAALTDGKWEGTINRLRKNGQRFVARVVITPRHDRVEHRRADAEQAMLSGAMGLPGQRANGRAYARARDRVADRAQADRGAPLTERGAFLKGVPCQPGREIDYAPERREPDRCE